MDEDSNDMDLSRSIKQFQSERVRSAAERCMEPILQRSYRQEQHVTSSESLSVGEIIETAEPGHLSISAILNYCKFKILRPYLRLLAVMGLRPWSEDWCSCCAFLGYLYTLQVVIFMVIGYVLQYMACFRRDRGFYYKFVPTVNKNYIDERQTYEQICYGSILFSYIVPSALHLCAYLYALYLFQISRKEQLQSLMERVFLLSSTPSEGTKKQRRLLHTLWLFVALSILWMIFSLIVFFLMMAEGTIVFQWIESSPQEILMSTKVLLTISTLWHDTVQATIVTSYCLQAQLLMSHLHFLKARLVQRTISPLNWMREISEFRKLLRYLNNDLGPAVCFFTIVNVSWASSGIVWLLNYDSIDKDTLPVVGVSSLNVLLWLVVSVAPFMQAARLTSACTMMQGVGHDIRTRPFAYQDMPNNELDTILLYSSSLRMSAKLFRVPIRARFLCLLITVGVIVILTLGQCHFLQNS